MNKGLQLRCRGKSSHSNGFSLVNKVANIFYKGTRLLIHYGTMVLDFISALVPNALATFGKITQKTMAFTLAETLIVMGVIGIVSALTLPNLNSSTGEKEIVTKVKKIYQNLNDAFGRAEAVYGPYDEWFINDTNNTAKAKRAGERFTEFLKVSKNCGMEANKGCFSSGNARYLLSGDEGSAFDSKTDAYKVITADGTSVAFRMDNDANQLGIRVDIDGPNKGSYTFGKDLFSFYVLVATQELLGAGGEVDFNTIKSALSTGLSAPAWIIKYDNADYLKLDSQGKCPNGTTPTEANPRCK